MPRYCLTSEGRAQDWDKRALGPEHLHPLLSWAADTLCCVYTGECPLGMGAGLSTEDALTRREDMWRLCNCVHMPMCVYVEMGRVRRG